MMKFIVRHVIRSLPITVIGLVFLEIVVTNQLVTQGRGVQEIDERIAKTSQENEFLAQRIASSSSLLRLQEKAKTLGFIPPPAPIVLGFEKVAVLPTTR